MKPILLLTATLFVSTSFAQLGGGAKDDPFGDDTEKLLKFENHPHDEKKSSTGNEALGAEYGDLMDDRAAVLLERAKLQNQPNNEGESSSEFAQIGIIVEWVKLDSLEANQLIREHAAEKNADVLRDTVFALVEAETASLMGTTHLRVTPGGQSSVSSLDRMIYPTEWKPVKLPETGGTGKESSAPTAASPTAFKTEKIGPEVDVDVSLDDTTKLIELYIVPQLTIYEGKDYMEKEGSENDEPSNIWVPKFFTIRSNVYVTLHDGEQILLAAQNAEEEGKSVFVFLQANILR